MEPDKTKDKQPMNTYQVIPKGTVYPDRVTAQHMGLHETGALMFLESTGNLFAHPCDSEYQHLMVVYSPGSWERAWMLKHGKCNGVAASTPIDALYEKLSVRAIFGLQSIGITTLKELTDHTQYELLRIRNFGRKSLCEVKNALKDLNLELKGEG